MARYEAREIDANVQMQRIALQCREEASMLRQKNETLTARCEQLEKQLRALSTAGSPPQSNGGTPSGCLPPKHEARTHASPEAVPTNSTVSTGYSPPPSTGAATPTPNGSIPHMPMLRQSSTPSDPDEIGFDCGFCPDQNLCVCRGKAKLEFGEEMHDPLTPGATPSLYQSVPPQTQAAVPLVRSTRPKPRLWATTPMSDASNAPSPIGTRVGSWAAGTSPGAIAQRAGSRPRLWAVHEPEQKSAPSPRRPSAPSCTGDQKTCSACNADPALATFCSAVSRSVQVPMSTQRQAPLPPPSAASAASPGRRETVPHAFTRIRNHPNFSQWKGDGGLQMLAEIVSRDSKDEEASRGDAERLPPRPAGGGSPSRKRSSPSPQAVQPMRRSAPDASPDVASEGERRKRTRADNMVYVRSEAVSEALAMLDRPGEGEEDAGAAIPHAKACPCPWVNTSSRLPWPR